MILNRALLIIGGIAATMGAAAAFASPSPTGAGAATLAPESYIRAEDHRVASIAYRLSLAGLASCPNSFPATGFLIHQLGEYEPADRPFVVETYRLDIGPGVLTVLADSPAARAGLVAGDVLLSVNSKPFPAPAGVAADRDSSKERTPLEAADAQIDAELNHGPVKLEVLRAGVKAELTLAPVPACLGRVRLARSNQANAFADGKYAIMTTKLLGFVRNDDELAIVLAHELSHNILGHPARLKGQKVPRGILRQFGKNASRIWATEEEADRLSVKLLAAAGYDLAAVMPFWQRYYANYDFLPQIFRTHPSLGARERIFREAIAELGSSGASR